MPTRHVRRRRVRAGLLTAVVLTGVAGGCLALALHVPDETSVARATTPTGTASAGPETLTPTRTRTPTPTPTTPAPAHAPPVNLRIPAIQVSASVVELGLNPDKTVEVPSDPATTGWFRLGPPPGGQGSAVILGHVDSQHGPAVFYRLRFLQPDDRIVVSLADGSTAQFRVTEVATYLNEDFPAEKVYGGHGGAHTLQLVTCGGDYDSQTGYQSNVVVYTTLVGTAASVT